MTIFVCPRCGGPATVMSKTVVGTCFSNLPEPFGSIIESYSIGTEYHHDIWTCEDCELVVGQQEFNSEGGNALFIPNLKVYKEN